MFNQLFIASNTSSTSPYYSPEYLPQAANFTQLEQWARMLHVISWHQQLQEGSTKEAVQRWLADTHSQRATRDTMTIDSSDLAALVPLLALLPVKSICCKGTEIVQLPEELSEISLKHLDISECGLQPSMHNWHMLSRLIESSCTVTLDAATQPVLKGWQLIHRAGFLKEEASNRMFEWMQSNDPVHVANTLTWLAGHHHYDSLSAVLADCFQPSNTDRAVPLPLFRVDQTQELILGAVQIKKLGCDKFAPNPSKTRCLP